jgi:hypothetical protein
MRSGRTRGVSVGRNGDAQALAHGKFGFRRRLALEAAEARTTLGVVDDVRFVDRFVVPLLPAVVRTLDVAFPAETFALALPIQLGKLVVAIIRLATLEPLAVHGLPWADLLLS